VRGHLAHRLVFTDGHHDEQATFSYYLMIAPHLAPGAILVCARLFRIPRGLSLV
jgi:hypothetical protein